jgi:hypothetical protein
MNEVVARESASAAPQRREIHTKLCHQLAQFFILGLLDHLSFNLSSSLIRIRRCSVNICVTTHVLFLIARVADAYLGLLPLSGRREITIVVVIRIKDQGSTDDGVCPSSLTGSDLVLRTKWVLKLVMI